jgi:opacity protein-like surface antigen
MGRLKLFTILGAAVGLAGPALAADLLGPSPRDYAEPAPAPGLAIAELGSGWYLRGDIGYVDYGKPGEKPYGVPVVPFDSARLKSTYSAGLGIGYKFTSWLRADITGDYRNAAAFDARSSRTGYTEGYSLDHGKMQSSTLLLNGYIDLGTWSGITPYVGAGVGVAQNRFNNYSGQVVCLTAACGDPTPGASYPLGAQARTWVPSGTRTHLAWALMAGASMEIMPGFLIDAGYRYVRLGDARTKLDQYGVGTSTKELSAHEIRVGIRYMID